MVRHRLDYRDNPLIGFEDQLNIKLTVCIYIAELQGSTPNFGHGRLFQQMINISFFIFFEFHFGIFSKWLDFEYC